MSSTAISPSHSAPVERAGIGRLLRSESAAPAQGFAQIMQAFETDDASPVVKNLKEQGEPKEPAQDAAPSREEDGAEIEEDDAAIRQAQDAAAKKPESAGEGDEQQSEQIEPAKPVADEGLIVQQPRPQADRTPVAEPTSATGSPIEGAEPEAQIGTQQEQATLRLLEKQSEQAKLSIKGLVRSLTHAADADLTAIAVGTRLGHDQGVDGTPGDASEHPSEPASGPSSKTGSKTGSGPASGASGQSAAPVDPARTQQEDPHRDQALAFNAVSSRPTHDPEHGAAQGTRVEPLDADQARPGDSRRDQAGSDAAQARGSRSDASIAAAPAQAAPAPPAQAALSKNPGAIRGVESAGGPRSVQAASGSQAGGLGTQLDQPGSLVEKLEPTKLPDETRRSAVLAQVQRGLASLLRSGAHEMTLKLNPASLGEVKIRIKTGDRELSVRFETSSDEAGKLIGSSVKELGAHLRSKGIHLNEVRIEHPSTAPSGDASHSAHHPGAESGADQSSAGRGDQRGGRSDRQEHAVDEFSGGFSEDSAGENPGAIWTELGLDAIA